MPKINVYLPDDLAAAVRATGVPVSQVCQLALADAVRSVGAARQAVAKLRDPAFDSARAPQLASRLGDRMTPRARAVLHLAQHATPADARVGTRELLIGLLDEGGNLAVRVLPTLLVDLDDLRAAAEARTFDEPAAAPLDGEADSDPEPSPWPPLTIAGYHAIAAALEASIELGHNYVGCEHLLLGLLADADSAAGRLLREFGVEPAAARRAVTSALAGFVQAMAAAPTAPVEPDALSQILRRLDALERRLGERD